MHGVIDIGSNSVLLLLAERDAGGRLTILEDRATITRISEGASATGRLSEEAIARTVEALRAYRVAADEVGVESLTAVATEGVRMANNAEAFLGPAAQVLGVPVRTVSGEEEARLSYRSVALEEPGDAVLRVVDVGGASTELCCGRGLEVEDVRSHAFGAVRLTERHVADAGAIRMSELEAIASEVRRRLAAQPLAPSPVLHGLAGTVTTLAAMSLELEVYDRDRVHGSELSLAELKELRDALADMGVEARCRAHPALSTKRADVIVTGAQIVIGVMEHCGAETLRVRDRGLRYALIPLPAPGDA